VSDARRTTPLRTIVLRAAAVGVGLATLLFIVISNVVGWSARVEITQVKRVCAGPACEHELRVEGRDEVFRVSDDVEAVAGDAARIRVTCRPRCELELTGVWPSAGGPLRALPEAAKGAP
jgi:hypothetical protein